jgi:hypothetical protein
MYNGVIRFPSDETLRGEFMPARRVRYLKSTNGLSVEGKGRTRAHRLYPIFDTLENLGEVSLASLIRAGKDYCAHTGREVMTVNWTAYGNEVFDPDVTAPNLARIDVGPEGLLVFSSNMKFDPPTASVLDQVCRDRVAPVLDQHGCTLEQLTTRVGRPTDTSDVEAAFKIPLYGRTVGDAALIASQVYWALGEALAGARSEPSAMDALREGQPAMLVGQAESDWLEVKPPYRLDRKSEKLELAKDVAAFGNAPNGGLIAMGLETTKQQGKDVIRRVRPFDLDRVDQDQYRQLLNHYIFPPLQGVVIKKVKLYGNKGCAYIQIPAQPPESRPILVIGHSINDRIISHYLTVPSRVGDGVLFRNPASLHSLLVAGRVAIANADARAVGDLTEEDDRS